jgi:hypothetical protein
LLSPEIIKDGITFNCELMVDATMEEKRDEFLRANADNVKVQSVLNDRLAAENRYLSKDRLFAYDVIDQIAKQRFCISEEIGFVHSEIYGNIDLGRGEGTYKAQKLAQAMCRNHSNLYAYYSKRYRKEEYEAMVNAAASDVAKILFGWTLVNSSEKHSGTSAIFGKPKKKRASACTRIDIKNMRDADENQKTGLGLPHYNVHYIFGTAAAIIEYLYKRNEKHSIANIRAAIEQLYDIRGMHNLDDKTLAGKGGNDIFDKISKDADALNKKSRINKNKTNEGKFEACM